jgi:Reverse transcriptase (RNA-dependent DNA polymerase)
MAHPTENRLMEPLTSDTTLDAAYDWLTSQKEGVPSITGHQWATLKPQLQEQLASGEYSFSVQTRVQRNEEMFDLWTDQDRIVLKAMTLALVPVLTGHVSMRCFHLGDRGGARAAVHETGEFLEGNQDSWVMQSDVTSYYGHIDHHTLYGQLRKLLTAEKFILRLLWQYMNRVVYDGENYLDIGKGISPGCSLSPLMAALYLKPLDTVLEEAGGFYARFMDDWVLVVPTRWQLRTAVKEAGTCLYDLGLDKHPQKTFIGRSGKGFDFLGYHLTPHQLTVSGRAIMRRDEEIARIYEQGADIDRVGQYVSRWQKWARAGVGVLAGAGGCFGASAIALGATVDNTFPSPYSGNFASLDLDGDLTIDVFLTCTDPTRSFYASGAPGNTIAFTFEKFIINSIPFGPSPTFSQSSASTSGPGPAAPPFYLRTQTSGGYSGWLTINTDCSSVRFVGELSPPPTLMPDGTGVGNAVPTISNLSGDAFTFTEGSGATAIDQDTAATVTDADSADFNTGNLTTTITSGEDAAEDILSLDISGTVALAGITAGSDVSVGGVVVGTLGNTIAAGNDLVVNFTVNATLARVQTLVQAITYFNSDTSTPTAGVRNVRVTVNDGDGGTSANNDVTVSVVAINTKPVITNLDGDSFTFTEGASASLIDQGSNATVSDLDSSIKTLTATISSGGDATEDLLSFNTSGTVALAGTTADDDVSVGGTVVGILANDIAYGKDLEVNLNISATVEHVQTLVRAITYFNGDTAAPTTGARNVRVTVTDVDGGTSANNDVSVTVEAVNDPPTNSGTFPKDITVTEDVAGNVVLSGMTLTDVDSAGNVVVTLTATSGTLAATTGGSVTVGGSGSAILTLTGTVTNVDTFLNTITNIKYTGSPNANGTAAATVAVKINDNDGSGDVALGTFNVDITAVGDTPDITGSSTNEDTQTTSGLVISRNANDSTEVSHFKITNISGGTLYKNDGSTAIASNDFITFTEGNAGLKFTPTTNSSSNGSFDIQAGTDGVGGGLSAGSATATISVTAVGDTPGVTGSSTNEDAQTTSGLVISRNANDSTEVSHFKITNISGGTLYKNDGSTAIANNDFVTFTEGDAGLKFTPTANSSSNGSFDIQAGTDGVGGGLSAGSATATISVTAVGDIPGVTGSSTNEDAQTTSGLVISRNANDSTEVSHFKITNINGGTLYKNDGTTAITNNDFITFTEGDAGLKFTPTANNSSNGSFDIQAGTDGVGGGLSAGSATATISVTAVGDTPQVADITTLEDTQSAPIVLNRNANDGLEVTHFRISGITNGILYQNDGVSIIFDGDFITFAQGNAGLKFTPSNNSTTAASFDIESSENGTTVAAQSGKATSTITVTPDNDAPTFTGTPTITGNAKAGQTLGLTDTGTDDVEGDIVNVSHQWKADGAAIAGAASATYTVTVTEKGKIITCSLTADDSNGGVTTFTTAGVEANKSSFPWTMFLPAITKKAQP